ncbi:hypothetical protein AOLI_G00251010 [Acnodon oligacanthus]
MPPRQSPHVPTAIATVAWRRRPGRAWLLHTGPKDVPELLLTTHTYSNTWSTLSLIMAASHCEEPPLRSGLLILRPHG